MGCIRLGFEITVFEFEKSYCIKFGSIKSDGI